MVERVRHRNRPQTSEDVMAVEPEMEFSSAGPHVPMRYHRSRDNKSDDEEPLIKPDDVSFRHLIALFCQQICSNFFRVWTQMPVGSKGHESLYAVISLPYVYYCFYIYYRLLSQFNKYSILGYSIGIN